MLVHLSTTSPYLCDISLGPIEQANRMAAAPTKKVLPYLEMKESFPRLLQPTRTPLKLLAPDEVPMDSSVTTTTTENNTSRQQSLQPIWYTEQTILDEHNEQQRNSNKSPGHRLDLTRSTLPTIESYSPEIEDEIIEKESLSNRPSLKRKSSTFTMEPEASILNESEKENDYNAIITSTQKEPTNEIHHPQEPSDESFRALEHLLGLGSTNTNLTMMTMAHESPKSNHESLSLTIVTPTELINQTTNSLHLSYAPAGGGSIPSSQNILLMPTIESITEPSMNSTVPPPFLVDNSDIEEPSSMGGTVLNQDNTRSTGEDDLFHDIDDDDDDERQETLEDESNFSFELHDFPNSSTNEPIPPPPPRAPPIITFRAPTSADVAYRALIKPRTGGRSSQPLRALSPLAKSTARSSVPASAARGIRSCSRRLSVDLISEESTTDEVKLDNDGSPTELVEVVSLLDEDELESEQPAGITLNLTETKEIDPVSPVSAEEADCSASSSASHMSTPQTIPPSTDPKMPVLSREFTFNTPTGRVTRSSERRRSLLMAHPSHPRLTHSVIPTIPEQQTTTTEEEKDVSSTTSDNTSICSIPSSSKTVLSTLSTNPTAISEAPPIVLQKSLAGSASPSPNPTPVFTIRRSDRLSLNLSPRRSINPLHSSTPSTRNKPLQMVSIGEQEQLSTTAPQQLNIDVTTDDVEMIDNEQQTNIPIQILHVADEGIQTSPEKPSRGIDISVQTTPSLDPSSRRRFQTIEQQTSPIVPRSSSSSSCQTTPFTITIQRSSTQQTSPLSKVLSEEQVQPQVTPLHSKAMMHLRRNVRFQFTPSTDARLAAKEKSEEQEQQHSKQEIVIHNHPTQIVVSDNEREEDTEDEIKKSTKTKKKITASKKKKIVSTAKNDDSSEEMIESPVHRTTRNQPSKITEPEVTASKVPKKKATKPSAPLEEKDEAEVIVTTKPANRKRPNPKTSTLPVPETTSPTEPVAKKTKTAKTLEVKEPVRAPSPDPPSTRNRSKTSIVASSNVKSASPPEPTERPPTSKKAKKTSLETNSAENPPSIPTTNKRKNPPTTMKKSKRRLHSVEQDEGLNTADEEEVIPSLDIPSVDLTQEEREKIEGLTVAELKARLTTHHENIPKGARKADLVALLLKIQTNPSKEHKQTEIIVEVPASSTSRKTRRKK